MDFLDEIRSNPLLLAVGLFVVGIFIYFVHKQVAGSAKPAIDATGPVDQGLTTMPPTVNNVYNYYPTVPINSPGPSPTPTPTPTPVPVPKPVPVPTPTPTPTPVPKPVPTPVPAPTTTARYVTVTTWPNPGSSLWSIAQMNGTSLAHIEALNPLSSLPSHNYNLIYPGQRIRVA